MEKRGCVCFICRSDDRRDDPARSLMGGGAVATLMVCSGRGRMTSLISMSTTTMPAKTHAQLCLTVHVGDSLCGTLRLYDKARFLDSVLGSGSAGGGGGRVYREDWNRSSHVVQSL